MDKTLIERIGDMITAVMIGVRHQKGTWLRPADAPTLHEALNQALKYVAGYGGISIEKHPNEERAKHEILFKVMFDDESSKVFTAMLAQNECQIDPIGFYPLPTGTE